ncbi:MAG: purine-nucleoside phosphorylase, partial [Plesiomonas shigelloides]
MTAHINAQPGDFAETVIMPGDPLRARYIAETYLTD